ncbi:dTDP-glucose 4,6-dehydratase [Streptomonospora sp. PA3]|uniref:dTDP-glucose 4,6-dehydratase n=1 Tax=Streptomonospora sp. PA3 TaxID=2607326 RepID=UPI0012DE1240|nr:dTDP-glucose 4,6-dehydratase [Streptomonospora sp. PA3]MUL41466.1 dTDP-glucose 4,6-dehydratase [Streptomonospora sp. PA3]
MILVTGGAGFIGSHFVRSLLSGNYPDLPDSPVTVLDKLTYAGNRENLGPAAADSRLSFVEGDICDKRTVDEIMPGHRLVIHFAAESHVDRSIPDSGAFVSTNVLGSQVLLDAALRHGVQRFVHVSTDEVYGSITTGTFTESSPLRPNSPYAASKAAADLLARAFHRTHGLDVVTTRGSNTYGPYQFPEKIIPLFITRLLDGASVPLYGDGSNVRDWLHVDDHCKGIASAAVKGRAGGVYHIGGGTEMSNRRLTELLLDACGQDWSKVEYTADRAGHDMRYSLSIENTTAELGYVPRIDFEGGIAATVDWYRENRTWWEPLTVQALPG